MPPDRLGFRRDRGRQGHDRRDARKKLTESDDWAVLAFALSANGVKLKESVGPHNAASIVLHP